MGCIAGLNFRNKLMCAAFPINALLPRIAAGAAAGVGFDHDILAFGR
jgi:hypothetical protein